jgi:hypothetical protein
MAVAAAATVLGIAGSAYAGFETLAHHWNFDEGPDWHDDPFQTVAMATVVQDSVGFADAALQGMDGTSFVSGRQYTGLAFDGVNDSLLAATDLAPVLGGTSSLSFWIKTTQSGAATAVSAPGVLGSTGVQWGWIDADGKMVLSVDGAVVVRSADPMNDGIWHHLVITRNAATGDGQIFLDGSLSGSSNWAAGTRSAVMTRFGHMQNGSSALFQGTLDQIHAFNGVVDSATVQALYDNHAPKTWVVNSDGETSVPFSTDSALANTYVYDAEQDSLSVASFTQPAHGSVTHNGDGSFTFTATGGYIGADAFTVLITDGRGGFTENTIKVVVTGPSAPGSGNRTSTFTDFQAIDAGGSAIALSGWRVPRAIDWNNDGDKDLLIGDDSGIWRYDNTGTPTAPVFAAGVRVQASGSNISLSGNILIALADMTGDAVDDLIVVGGDRQVRIYRNTSVVGTVPVYAAATLVPSSAGGNFILPDQRFDAADWDGDGLVDLVMGTRQEEVRVYRNVGTASAPVFDSTDYEVLESSAYNIFPRVFDINLNNTPDYIRGINWGSINYWFDPSLQQDGLGNQNGALTITDSSSTTVDVRAVTDGAMVDFADFNGDGVLDILIGGHSQSGIYIAYGVAKTVADSIAAIEAIYDAHPTGLGAALEANGQALLSEINAAATMIIMHMQAATLSERQAMFPQMVAHVGNYAFLQMETPVDKVEYNHIPSIAGQNLMTMHEMLQDTPGQRINVANAVGLAGTQREVYLQMGVHVGDNQEAPAGQIEAVRDFMKLQPRESFPDAGISLDNYYDNGREGWINTFRGAKNTFGFGEGSNRSEWASDLNTAAVAFYGSDVQKGDYFTFVMGHEVTHSLDGYVRSRANQDLWRRSGQMLTLAAGSDVLSAAGDNHGFWSKTVTQSRFLNQGYWDGNGANWDAAWDAYWTTGPGSVFHNTSFMRGNMTFFLKSPQEAMATQANHHWAHAEARLTGAIDRYQRGVAQGIEPMKANITEVLTFLDWISCGMNKIVMQDTKGVSAPYAHAEFLTTHAWLERDEYGYITKVTTRGRLYEFEVDAFGIVTDLLVLPSPIGVEKGLVAHWKFDDGSGLSAFDDTGKDHTGTLVNGPVWATGFDAGALSFDGVNDAVTFGTGPSLSGQSDLTLTAWINTSASTEQVILQQRDTAEYNGQYVLQVLSTGRVQFYIYGNGAYQFTLTTSVRIDDGEWHFVTAVRDGMNGYIYIDGNPVPAASGNGTIRDLRSSAGVGVGRDIRDKTKSFNGLIDDVAIYNIAHSGPELGELYNRYFDTDGDGMPNDWEIAHSLNPLVDDTAENPDHDAYDNWDEYVTDTHPLYGSSRQTFSLELAPGTGEPTVRFSTSASRRYVVEYHDDLTSGIWQDVAPAVSGTGSEMTIPVGTIELRRFYRLRIELP